MQYLLLIYENESNRGNVDRAKIVEEYGKFTKSIIESERAQHRSGCPQVLVREQ